MEILDKIIDKLGYIPKAKQSLSSAAVMDNSEVIINVSSDTSSGFSYQALCAKYNSWVYTAINKIALTIAQLSFNLYTYKKNGKYINGLAIKSALRDIDTPYKREMYLKKSNIEKIQIFEHPFLQLYNSPNLIDTRFSFVYNVITRLELAGMCPIYMPKNALGLPGELWALPLTNTAEFKIIPDAVTGIRGYTYKDGSISAVFDLDEILLLKYPSPASPFAGMSPIMAQGYPYAIDQFLLQQENSLLKNKSTFGNVLSTDQQLVKSKVDEIKTQLKENYEGALRSGKPLVLHSGLKLLDARLTQNLRDSMAKEAGEEARDRILTAYGLTPSGVGLIKETNRSAIETLDKVYIEGCIRPKTMIIEEVFERFLLPRYDEGLTLDFVLPKTSQRELDIQEKQIDLSLGVRTINDFNREENRPEVPWGDKPWLPFSVMQPGGDSQSYDLQNTDNEQSEQTSDEDDMPGEKTYGDRGNAKSIKWWTADRKKTASAFFVQKVERLKGVLENIIREYLRKQIQEISGRLESGEAKMLLGNIKGFNKFKIRMWVKDNAQRIDAINIDVEKEAEILAKELLPGIKFVMADIGSDRLQSLGVTVQFDYADPKVAEYLGAKLLKHSKVINQATFTDVNAILTEGFKEGASTFEMAQMLREKFESWATYRCQSIARTETISASNFADLEAVEQSGLAKKLRKFWLNENDARNTHLIAGEKYNPEGAIPIDDYFVVGLDKMQYPGGGERAEENMNCRCTLGYREA